MKTFEELWELLTTQDESNQIEVKRGSEVGKSCKETICAFANEPGLNGGYLILGIIDPSKSDSGEYEITGVNDPDKIQQTLAGICNDETFNYRFRPEITLETIDGKTVVIAYIPEAPANQKPIYLRKEGLPKGAFRRIGSSDQKCNDEDLKLFYQEQNNQSYDKTIVPEAYEDELDPNALKRYRQIKQQQNPNAPELTYNDHDLLLALNALGRNPKQPDIFHPTVAGLLLFGKEITLRRHFPLHRVDYIFIEGTQWVENSDQRYTYANEVREPLLIAIPKLVNMIINDLPKSFHLPDNELQRQDIPLIPLKVIREAVVNALMHRDYRINSPIQIIRYADRLEFRNVGYSLKDIEQIDEPVSYPRNPAIASIFHDLNLAEVKGTGGRSIINEMRAANLSIPNFNSNREQNTFCLTLRTHHLIGQEETQWLTQFKDFNLTDEEARALILVKQAGKIDNFTYRVATGLDTLAASKSLINLRDKGILTAHGKGRATYYTLASQQIQQDSKTVNQDSKTANQDSRTNEPRQLELALPSSKTLPTPTAIAEALGKRPSNAKMTAMILELCSIEPLSSSELANILNRDRKYLLNKFLTPLLEEGLLAYSNPEKPNDPNQTYTTPKAETNA